MLRPLIAAAALASSIATPLAAQAPVESVADPEALFHDSDPAMDAKKQVALRIMRELLQCNHWSDAGKWLSDRYIQHNPNVSSGLAPVMQYFGSRPRTPTCDKLTSPVVSVLDNGTDIVGVVTKRTIKHPEKPGETYTTVWFDMWRFVDGKADEHWDSATIAPPRTPGQ